MKLRKKLPGSKDVSIRQLITREMMKKVSSKCPMYPNTATFFYSRTILTVEHPRIQLEVKTASLTDIYVI